MSWNESTNNQKIKNSKKRLAKKIQQLVRTDARRKAEEGQDEGSDDTLQDGSGDEICFFNQCQLKPVLTLVWRPRKGRKTVFDVRFTLGI